MSRNNIQSAVTVAIWLIGGIPLWFVWDFAFASESRTWFQFAMYVAAILYIAQFFWLRSKLSVFFPLAIESSLATQLDADSIPAAPESWMRLLSDYKAAQEAFDAASDVLSAHLAMGTLPVSNEVTAEKRARAQVIAQQKLLCAGWNRGTDKVRAGASAVPWEMGWHVLRDAPLRLPER